MSLLSADADLVVTVMDALNAARALIECVEMATDRLDRAEGRPMSEALLRASAHIRDASEALGRLKVAL